MFIDPILKIDFIKTNNFWQSDSSSPHSFKPVRTQPPTVDVVIFSSDPPQKMIKGIGAVHPGNEIGACKTFGNFPLNEGEQALLLKLEAMIQARLLAMITT